MKPFIQNSQPTDLFVRKCRTIGHPTATLCGTYNRHVTRRDIPDVTVSTN
jgi:hypothetical protein